MLTWAIGRAGHALEDFLHRYPQVRDWIEQVRRPTVKQLEDFAKRVYIPFGYLFLTAPPDETISFPFFRKGGRRQGDLSLNVFDTIRLVQRRQDWLSQYLEENGGVRLPFIGRFDQSSDHHDIVEDIRKTLNVGPEWASSFSTYEESLNFIGRQIEAVGIMVVFNGVVENNTHRPIPVDECRGFVLVDEFAPFMFINAADAKGAQLFTVIHELAHIWLGVSAGFQNENLLPAEDELELLCDRVAAEFLVPADTFDKLWHSGGDINKLSRFFKVSAVVIARRALDLGKISKSEFFSYYRLFMANAQKKREAQSKGGDFYATARKRIGASFAAYVDQAVRQNKLLYRDAYKITGLRGDTYQNFITNLI